MEVPNKKIIGWSGNTIKLFQNKLEILHIGRLVHDILKLILISITKFFSDIIYKNSSLSKVFLHNDFKFGPVGGHQSIGSHLLFILLSLVQGLLFEKCDSEKNSIATLRVKRGKIIFILLDKVVIIYMRLALINV